MKFELSLLENSIDFLKESIAQYLVADENGTHLQPHSDINNKKKWKMAFITLVQAIELLMKEIIAKVSIELIKANIDSSNQDEKTITFEQCIIRLNKFTDIQLLLNEEQHLLKCAKMRNRFTHYDVSITSEEVKKKYSALFSLYKRLFEEGLNQKLTISSSVDRVIEELITFSHCYTIYRGMEILKENLADYEKEISEAQEHPYFKDKHGVMAQRIKFGYEEIWYKGGEVGESDNYNSFSIYLRDYCDDCGAKQGEYHLYHCDLERCPICGCQALNCDCSLTWSKG